MSSKYHCKIGYKKGFQLVLLPDGTAIPGQIKTVVTSELGDYAKVTVDLIVDLSKVYLDDEVKLDYCESNNDTNQNKESHDNNNNLLS